MDLSVEEMELQREALIRIEQERKDAEIARRLEETEAAERADRTLTPEEIARILDEDLEGPAQRRQEIGEEMNRARRSRPNRLVGRVAHIQNPPRDRRRRLNNDDGEGLAHGEPIANRPRLLVHVQQVQGDRQRLRIVFDNNRRNNRNVEQVEEDISSSSSNSSDSELDEEGEDDENGDNELNNENRRNGLLDDDEEIEGDDEEDEEEESDEETSSDDEDDSDIIVEEIFQPPGREIVRARGHIAFNAGPIFHEEAEAAYRGELEILEVPDMIDLAPSQRAGLRTLPLTPPRNDQRDAQYGDCTLCFEAPNDPTGCNQCKQLLGCKACVNKWYHSSMTSHTVPTCPLCRCPWSNRPDVRQMRYIEAEKRRARLRRTAATNSTRNPRN